MDRWTEGRSLGQLLRVSRVESGLERKPTHMSLEEFTDRFAGVDITHEDIHRAVRVGLVKLDGSEVVIANESFIDLGAAAARTGIPVSEILDEHAALMISVNGIADRFRKVFEHHFWEPFVERGMPTEEIPSLTEAVDQLTEVATSVVVAELHERFATFAKQYLTRATESVAKGHGS